MMTARKMECQKTGKLGKICHFIAIFTFLAVLSLETRHTRAAVPSIYVGAPATVLARIVLALVNVYK